MTIDQKLIELWESSNARAAGIKIEDFQTSEIEPFTKKIVFCTNIKEPERFETWISCLERNIDVFNKVWKQEHYKPNVQFEILAYGEPELETFICKHLNKNDRKNYRPRLDEAFQNNIVVLTKTEAQDYSFASAKNTAARIAIEYCKGRILCILDGDNYIGAGGKKYEVTEDIPDFITFLRNRFHQYQEILVRSIITENDNIGRPLFRGIGGRIATTSELFLFNRGYDEDECNAWGGDDRDFMIRAFNSDLLGYRYVELVNPQDPLTVGNVIEHPSSHSWKNMSRENQAISEERNNGSTKRWAEPVVPFEYVQGDETARILDTIASYDGGRGNYRNPVRFANVNGLPERKVQIGHYNAEYNRFDFHDYVLPPLDPPSKEH